MFKKDKIVTITVILHILTVRRKMVWISLVLACVYFALNSPVIAFPEKTETLHGNQNWKLAMKKIEELQKIVRFQEDRINSLEKRREEPAEKVIELQRILKNHCGRITQLETRVIELESKLKKEKEPIAIHPIEQGFDSLKPTDISNNRISVFRKGTSISFHLYNFCVNCLLN